MMSVRLERCRSPGRRQPGIFDQDIESLTEPGTRLGETVKGRGLELAIARTQTGKFADSLVFDRSESLGGLRGIAVLELNSKS